MIAEPLLVGAYVAVVPGLVSPFSLPKLAVVVAGAATAVWATKDSPPAALRRPMLLVIAAATLSAAFSDSPLLSLAGRPNSTSGGLIGLLAAWLCYEAGRREGGGLERAIRFVLIGAAISGLAGVLQVLVGWPLLVDSLPAGGRAYGLAGSPPFLSCMMALALCLSVGGRWLPFLAILGGLLAAQSRSGMAGAVAGLLYLLSGARGAALGTVVIAVAGLVGAIEKLNSDDMRVHIWETAGRAFAQRPILGWGPEGFTDAFMLLRQRYVESPFNVADNAHNFALHWAVTGGVVGLGVWGYLISCAGELAADRRLVAATAAVFAYGCFNPIPTAAFCVLAFLWGAAEER